MTCDVVQISGDGNANGGLASIFDATVTTSVKHGNVVEIVTWGANRNYHILAQALPMLVKIIDLNEF